VKGERSFGGNKKGTKKKIRFCADRERVAGEGKTVEKG